MKILILRAFSHFREHKPSCEIRLICSCCRCAHFGSVSFPPPNRQSLKSVQSLNCVETLNSHEGNDILYHLQGQLASGFKPRSREGNDATGAVEGVTMERVSIHVPTRGTTISTAWMRLSIAMFQSTFPRGERRCGIRGTRRIHRVSIHVPTRGTTNPRQLFRLDQWSFNPRSREGNDSSCMCWRRAERGFNPRSREGNDTLLSVSPCYCRVFQSTFPRGERRRSFRLVYRFLHRVSIHVPARGTTMGAHTDGVPLDVSIHVPARGTTGNIISVLKNNSVSIHVPARGTTVVTDYSQRVAMVSIHVPARGTTSDRWQCDICL